MTAVGGGPPGGLAVERRRPAANRFSQRTAGPVYRPLTTTRPSRLLPCAPSQSQGRMWRLEGRREGGRNRDKGGQSGGGQGTGREPRVVNGKW